MWRSEQQRRRAALWMLVAGTLPVLLTGLGQLFWVGRDPGSSWRGAGDLVRRALEVSRRGDCRPCLITPTSPVPGWRWSGR